MNSEEKKAARKAAKLDSYKNWCNRYTFEVEKKIDGVLVNFMTTLQPGNKLFPKIIDVSTEFGTGGFGPASDWVEAMTFARNMVRCKKEAQQRVALAREKSDAERLERVAKHQEKQRAKAKRRAAK